VGLKKITKNLIQNCSVRGRESKMSRGYSVNAGKICRPIGL
jgi:hypothetical protein